MKNNDANRQILNTIGSAYVSLNLLPGLKFKSSFNYYLKGMIIIIMRQKIMT